MVNIIAKQSNASLVYVALLGSILSIPLIVITVLIYSSFGLWGALAFCVLTDLGAAFIMKEISVSAGIETFVIAMFLIIGVKIAPHITHALAKLHVFNG